jgi:hypothetical protein
VQYADQSQSIVADEIFTATYVIQQHAVPLVIGITGELDQQTLVQLTALSAYCQRRRCACCTRLHPDSGAISLYHISNSAKSTAAFHWSPDAVPTSSRPRFY